MKGKARIGIVGMGVMGQIHARIISELENAELVAIADINKDAIHLAEKYKTKYYKYTNNMFKYEKIDAVIIATPSSTHKRIALDCLKAGKHIFVEKPIAEKIKDGEDIITAARKHNKILMVGHVERFNPAATNIKKYIDDGMIGDVYLINTRRCGPFPKRLLGTNAGVITDLAVHDVDIIQYLRGPISQVFTQTIISNHQDIYAKCLFKVGEINASAEFSWLSPQKIRTIEVYGSKGILKGDFITQGIWFYENGDLPEYDKNYFPNVFISGSIGDGKIIKFPSRFAEPLKIEDAHFIDCVLNKKMPFVTPEQALSSLDVSLAIAKSGKLNKKIVLK